MKVAIMTEMVIIHGFAEELHSTCSASVFGSVPLSALIWLSFEKRASVVLPGLRG
jgi:hypothetical protein